MEGHAIEIEEVEDLNWIEVRILVNTKAVEAYSMAEDCAPSSIYLRCTISTWTTG